MDIQSFPDNCGHTPKILVSVRREVRQDNPADKNYNNNKYEKQLQSIYIIAASYVAEL
jgi:hypothetical protein